MKNKTAIIVSSAIFALGAVVVLAAGSSISDWIIDGSSMYATSTVSYVGIGTTTPETRLHVSGGHLLLSNDKWFGGESTSGSNITIAKIDTSDFLQIGETSSIGGIRFYPGATEKMRITSAGDIGIGTTTPNYKLEIAGGNFGIGANKIIGTNAIAGNVLLRAGNGMGSSPQWHVRNEADTAYGDLVMGAGFFEELASLTAKAPQINRYQIVRNNDAVNQLQFNVPAGAGFEFSINGAEKMVVDSGGNVGIGTTTPSSALHAVKGNATTTITVGGGNSPACLKLMDSDNSGWTYCRFLDGAMNCGTVSCE